MKSGSSISLLVLDCDGVLTPGTVSLDHDGREVKHFHTHDGFGLRLWQRLGFRVGVITGRSSQAMLTRATELGFETNLVQGSKDKLADLRAMCDRLDVPIEQAAFVGDDWPDIPPMRACGYAIAVANAVPEVKRAAAFVTSAPGGSGAVREVVMHLVEARGLMDQARGLYDTPSV